MSRLNIFVHIAGRFHFILLYPHKIHHYKNNYFTNFSKNSIYKASMKIILGKTHTYSHIFNTKGYFELHSNLGDINIKGNRF
jgi:hypothetical protein